MVGDAARGAGIPGTTVTGASLTCEREGHLLPLGPRLDPPHAGAGRARVAPRRHPGPWGARRGRRPWASAATTRRRDRRNRTETAGPLAYWMPLGPPCDSANTSRCGAAARVQVAGEDEREVGLRVRGGARRLRQRRRPPPRSARARRPPRDRDRGIAGGERALEGGVGSHPPILPGRDRIWASGAVLVRR